MLRGPALQWDLSAGQLVVKMTHRPRLTPPETVSPAAPDFQHRADFQQGQQYMVTSPSVLLALCFPAVAGVPPCTRVKRVSASRRCPEPITCRGFISSPLHPPWCFFATPRTVDHQAPLSMGFSRQEYWRGLPCLSLGNLPNPGIEPRSPSLQADPLPSEPSGKPDVLRLLTNACELSSG